MTKTCGTALRQYLNGIGLKDVKAYYILQTLSLGFLCNGELLFETAAISEMFEKHTTIGIANSNDFSKLGEIDFELTNFGKEICQQVKRKYESSKNIQS